jgi:hypothetical protein
MKDVPIQASQTSDPAQMKQFVVNSEAHFQSFSTFDRFEHARYLNPPTTLSRLPTEDTQLLIKTFSLYSPLGMTFIRNEDTNRNEPNAVLSSIDSSSFPTSTLGIIPQHKFFSHPFRSLGTSSNG